MSNPLVNPMARIWVHLQIATEMTYYDFKKYIEANHINVGESRIRDYLIPCKEYTIQAAVTNYLDELSNLFNEKQLILILHNYYSDTMQINSPLAKDFTMKIDMNKSINRLYIDSVYYYTDSIVFSIICMYGTLLNYDEYTSIPEIINYPYDDDDGAITYCVITMFKFYQ